MKFYGLYKITNLVNGKMYIGQHVTDNLDDGYMGSGKIIKLALQKYGKANFRKEWLGFYEDRDELNYMELVFVDDTWVNRADTYNISLGGRGHSVRNHTQEEKRHLSNFMKGKRNALGCKRSDVFKQSLSNRMKGKRLRLGMKNTDNAKAGISAGNLGKKFWNNGVVNVKARECPEGFVAGRLTKGGQKI